MGLFKQHAVDDFQSGMIGSDSNGLKLPARAKGICADGGDAVGNGDAGQSLTSVKRPAANGSDAVGNGDVGQRIAGCKFAAANVGGTVENGEIRQIPSAFRFLFHFYRSF